MTASSFSWALLELNVVVLAILILLTLLGTRCNPLFHRDVCFIVSLGSSYYLLVALLCKVASMQVSAWPDKFGSATVCVSIA